MKEVTKNIKLKALGYYKLCKGCNKHYRCATADDSQNCSFACAVRFKPETTIKDTVAWLDKQEPKLTARGYINNFDKKRSRSKKRTVKLRDPFYQTDVWLAARFDVLTRDGRECSKCGTNKGRMDVDHIVSRKADKSLELDLINLRVLCNKCMFSQKKFRKK